MLKKPKLLIFKVSDYHNNFSLKFQIAQLRTKLYNQQNCQSLFTMLSTKNVLPKRHSQRDQSDIQGMMNTNQKIISFFNAVIDTRGLRKYQIR